MTEARGPFPTLKIKEHRITPDWVTDGRVLAFPLPDDPDYQLGAFQRCHRGPIVGRLRFVDMTSGGDYLPSLVFATPEGLLAPMTCDAFRLAVLARQIDLVDGHIEGTFDVINYDSCAGVYIVPSPAP